MTFGLLAMMDALKGELAGGEAAPGGRLDERRLFR